MTANLADLHDKVAMSISDEKAISWPKEGAKLFVEDGDSDELSEIGWGSLTEKLAAYSNGYKLAADDLVDEVIKSKLTIKRKIYTPAICFLYRQHLELEMKTIYLYYVDASRDDKKSALEKMSHDLMKIWQQIKPAIAQFASNGSDKRAIVVVEDYIKQFHELDKTSFTFRYPITKNLKEVHERRSLINLQNLRERMNELYTFFIGCEGVLSEWRENARYIG